MKTVSILKSGNEIAKAWNANRYFLRLRGLLGRSLQEGGGLLLSPCGCIHTFGMRYAIDAVYLDRSGRVLRVDEALPKGRAWPGQKGAKRVLELPSGSAKRFSIQPGDLLEVVP
ncbi:MAG: DUF192 domain-containing protein [Eubacteriales bacterium]|nr:DUF192 domain-containing protein [Eubacteriales bacterium]